MPNKKITLSLPEAMIAFLDKKVEEGNYASRSDVVRDAVRVAFNLRNSVKENQQRQNCVASS